MPGATSAATAILAARRAAPSRDRRLRRGPEPARRARSRRTMAGGRPCPASRFILTAGCAGAGATAGSGRAPRPLAGSPLVCRATGCSEAAPLVLHARPPSVLAPEDPGGRSTSPAGRCPGSSMTAGRDAARGRPGELWFASAASWPATGGGSRRQCIWRWVLGLDGWPRADAARVIRRDGDAWIVDRGGLRRPIRCRQRGPSYRGRRRSVHSWPTRRWPSAGVVGIDAAGGG